nr:DNA polymerase III subunit gamma and tau [Microbacterium endophyticum]
MYRRYRPEAFGEMIGQAQVTEPLMTALRSDRVGHAYLFSGPRGCGKTTSARILARCLNCAEGPTDTPCGVCPSCVELGRDGGGSLDVVEIDAASHNGVDDARDLRERAVFAPARDRFKIFILDEAHMVTQQGFNALLKLVEEPPAHVKFIFATTEPEKVLGTIRSRTHHYPFRLVPPAAMLEYVGELSDAEGVKVESGVLPLVVRAGGGSPRDTLSLLDQLIAGSDPSESGGVLVRYERAVALLGYTHGALLSEVIDALASADAAAAFAAIDRVVQTGQDPRRFVEDLLERLRDLIVIAATGQGAATVLRGVPAEEIEQMAGQAAIYGSDRLSRTADIVIGALDEMTGATSPRLQLELMIARVLAHTSASSAAPTSAPASSPAAVPSVERDAVAPVPTIAAPDAPKPDAPKPEATSAPESAPVPVASGPVSFSRLRDAWPEVLVRLESISRSSWMIAIGARAVALNDDVLTLAFPSQSDVEKFKQRSAGGGPSEDLRQAILGVVGVRVKYIAKHESDLGPDSGGGPGRGPTPPSDVPPGDDSRGGARPGSASSPPAASTETPPSAASPAAQPPSAPVTDWDVAQIPSDDDAPPPDMGWSDSAASQFPVDDEPEDAAPRHLQTMVAAPVRAEPRDGAVLASELQRSDDREDDIAPPVDEAYAPPTVAPPIRTAPAPDGIQRYGEAVVRQVLNAHFVREEPFERATRFN